MEKIKDTYWTFMGVCALLLDAAVVGIILYAVAGVP